MADPYTRPYLDANVYITAIKGPTSEDPGKVDLAANILRLAEEGRFQIFASTFLVAMRRTWPIIDTSYSRSRYVYPIMPCRNRLMSSRLSSIVISLRRSALSTLLRMRPSRSLGE